MSFPKGLATAIFGGFLLGMVALTCDWLIPDRSNAIFLAAAAGSLISSFTEWRYYRKTLRAFARSLDEEFVLTARERKEAEDDMCG